MKLELDSPLKIEREGMALLDDLHELVFNFKLGGCFLFVNSVWLKKLRYEKADSVRLSFHDILQNDQNIKWRKIQQKLERGTGYAAIDFVFKTKTNESLIVQGSLQPMAQVGEARHVIMGIFQDVTPIRQAEKERDRLFLYSIDMLCILRYDGIFKRVNPAFHKTLGIPEEDFLRKTFIDFVHPEDQAKTLEEFSKLRQGIPSVCFENRYRHQNGSYRWLSWTAHPVATEKLIYAVARDVTTERNMKEAMKQMAYTDTLTGLYNRRGFSIAAERMQKLAYRNKQGLLLMMADLDNMKLINDRGGHPKGDAALIATAQIFRDRFRDSDLIARIGGDEFVVALLTNSAAQSSLIKKNLEESFLDYNKRIHQNDSLSVSVGFSFAPPGEKTSINELIAKADKAMYVFKRQRQVELSVK